MTQYDAIIIGSGQGGNPLSHKLADLGWRVALVEREHLGGSCVNYGCTPTKTMVASARVAHLARRAADFGVIAGDVSVNLPAIRARKTAIVEQGRSGLEKQVADRPTLDLHRGHARFTGPRTVEVDGHSISSGKIFINTGTRPRIPLLSGLSEVPYLTNRSIMDLGEVPDHLMILGGSYIGLEFGQMFRRFGSSVTIVDHNPSIIPGEDTDVSNALQEALESEGIRFRLSRSPISIAQDAAGLRLTISDGDSRLETIQGSHLLVATGRSPNTDDLGLDAAGVETDDHGFIKVNGRLETNVPGIWAIGDVKGGPAFTHISYDDHLIICDNLIEGKDRNTDGRVVPYALFTDPELGRAGVTERQARESGIRFKVAGIPMSRVARAVERDETAGLMKIVVDTETDRVLGAAVLGIDGGELVHVLMTLMLTDSPWTALRRAVYIHPTLAEGFFHLFEQVAPVDVQPLAR